ncbi:MAG: hypothetical protein ACR2ML_11110 [Solirubrobacteraceae bacterium]
MTADLTPDQALARLGELSSAVRDAVVLDARGGVLAGSEELGKDAAALVRATEAAAIEIADERGAVYAVRSGEHAIVALTTRPALPALMFYDLRAVLAGLGERPAA